MPVTNALDLYGGKQQVAERYSKEIIKGLRELKGRELEELAESLDFEPTFLYQVLAGTSLNFRDLRPLARTLMVNTKEVLGDIRYAQQSPNTRQDWEAEEKRSPIIGSPDPLSLESYILFRAIEELDNPQ